MHKVLLFKSQLQVGATNSGFERREVIVRLRAFFAFVVSVRRSSGEGEASSKSVSLREDDKGTGARRPATSSPA